MPTIATASSNLAPSPTKSSVSREGTPKSIIILSVFVPLVTIFGVAIIWRIARGRRRTPQSRNHRSDGLSQNWIAKVSRPWLAKKSSPEISGQIPNKEDEALGSGPGKLLVAATSNPQRSPFRAPSNQSVRPTRPASLNSSLIEITQAGGPQLYSGNSSSEHGDDVLLGNNSTSRTGIISQRPWRADIQTEERPQAHSGTRRVFYETAINRNFPFERLARPSLRLERYEDTKQEGSLTPEPLRIVKNTDSCTTIGDLLKASRGETTRRAFTEPAIPTGRMPRDAMESLEQDLMDELNSIGDGPTIDEETRRRRREQTLKYLEGALPMSPLPVYRASSVYSRDEWGSPILSQGESSATAVHDAAASGDNEKSRGKGKEKAVDQSGVEGGSL